ncbi:MAG: binding protein [Myxococcaceae bacterium]|nr:binding protein [Myxococcaceae bacterium]
MRQAAPKQVDKKELVSRQPALTGRQRRQLRALGHHLKVVVQIGAQGITEQVVAAAEAALKDHELIKVKIGDGPADRHEASAALAVATHSELAQLLGRTALLFRQRKVGSKIKLS